MISCPYCLSENQGNTLVCTVCSRDIAVPATLIAERDELLRKRDHLRDQLHSARQEVEMIMNRRKSR